MKDTLITDCRQLPLEGYLCEDRLEVEDNTKAYSNFAMSEKEENSTKVTEGQDLLEQILSPDNLNTAYKRVKKNKDSHGIDGMSIQELMPYLKEHGEELRQSILTGKYKPQPVRRVEIPKPDGGTGYEKYHELY